MYIIDVIPAAKIPLDQPQVLSYFFKSPIEPGCIVEAPLRKKQEAMLVVRSLPVSQRKAFVKSRDFALKGISRVITQTPFFNPTHLSFLKSFSQRWLMPISAVVSAALPPKRILVSKSFSSVLADTSTQPPLDKFTPSKTVIRGSGARAVCEAIRAALEARGTVLLCAPHMESASAWNDILKNSGMNPILLERNRSITQWKKALRLIFEGNPQIIVGTHLSLFLPIKYLSLVVVVDEDSPLQYHDFSLPHFYLSAACEDLADRHASSLILASGIPTLDAYAGIQSGRYALTDDGWNDGYKPEIIHLDGMASPFGISDAAFLKIRETFQARSKILVFTHRRGYGRSLLCNSCGFSPECKKCEIPFVYHAHAARRFLACHHCGTQEDAPTVCPQCKGYAFALAGIGSEQIASRLRAEFGSRSIFLCDSESTRESDEHGIIKAFVDSQNAAILIGTERIFKYSRALANTCALSVGAAFDQIFRLPDYRIEEQARRVVVKLYGIGSRCALESRDPERKFFKSLSAIDEAYRADAEFRKRFEYPPYAHVVKLVYRHEKEVVARDNATHAQGALTRAGFTVSSPVPAFIYRERGIYSIELFCTIHKDSFETNRPKLLALEKLLKTLPPGLEVAVDPFGLL